MPQLTVQRRALIYAGVLVAFVIALVAWSQGPALHNLKSPTAPHNALVSPSQPASSPGSSGSSSGSSSGAPVPPNQLVPNLPVDHNVDPSALPAHSVVISVTSDAPILRVGYIVLYGHPGKGYAQQIKSPASIQDVGRGFGLVASVGAQAAPTASYITCTITVDGAVHGTHTSHGGWAVTTCLG